MAVKTFYAIYDQDTKRFKGRGNVSGVRWTTEPTQTYDSLGRATSAMNTHLKRRGRWASIDKSTINLIIKEIRVSWDD